MSDLRKGRALTVFDFGALCDEILKHDGKYSGKMRRQLTRLRKKMIEASNDVVLKELFQADLLVLDEIKKMMACRNVGDEVGEMRHNLTAHRLWGAADAIADRIAKGAK